MFGWPRLSLKIGTKDSNRMFLEKRNIINGPSLYTFYGSFISGSCFQCQVHTVRSKWESFVLIQWNRTIKNHNLSLTMNSYLLQLITQLISKDYFRKNLQFINGTVDTTQFHWILQKNFLFVCLMLCTKPELKILSRVP